MPSGSEDPDPSNDATRSFADEVKAALGAWLAAATLTWWVTAFVAPPSSVTVSVTV